MADGPHLAFLNANNYACFALGMLSFKWLVLANS
jgi:hypothetical protein